MGHGGLVWRLLRFQKFPDLFRIIRCAPTLGTERGLVLEGRRRDARIVVPPFYISLELHLLAPPLYCLLVTVVLGAGLFRLISALVLAVTALPVCLGLTPHLELVISVVDIRHFL